MSVKNKEKIKEIAQDLNDRVGATLSAAKMHYASLKEIKHTSNEVKESFKKGNELIDISCNSIREISKQLKQVQ